MHGKIKIAGRAVHPMFVSYPLAFYTITVASYIVFNVSKDPFWFRVAHGANILGVVMGLLVVLPGFIEWLLSSRIRARSSGLMHTLCNAIALALFALNWYIYSGQWNSEAPVSNGAILISVTGLILTIFAGLLGGQTMQKFNMGPDRLTPAEIEAATHEGEIAIPN